MRGVAEARDGMIERAKNVRQNRDLEQDDGQVDICFVEKIGRVTALSLLQAAVKGTHVHSKHVTMRRCRHAVVESDVAMPIHIDGELFAVQADNVRRVTLTVLPGALRVVV